MKETFIIGVLLGAVFGAAGVAIYIYYFLMK